MQALHQATEIMSEAADMMEEGKYSIEFLAGINPGLAFD